MAATAIITAASLTKPRRRAVSLDAADLNQSMLHHLPSPRTPLFPPSTRRRRRHHPADLILRVLRSLCSIRPAFTPNYKLSSATVAPTVSCSGVAGVPLVVDAYRRKNHRLITGTLFGYRNGRISLSLQEDPCCLPSLVVELACHTHALLREMSAGMVRIALECDKKPPEARGKTKLLDEPVWTMFCNGKKVGYGVRRLPTEDDLAVMETLRGVSMGAGVLPTTTEEEEEMTYVRTGFGHVIGSRDSETLYMTNPHHADGDSPDLTIFFVRL